MRFTGRAFESWLGTIAIVALGKLCASVTKQYNLVLAKGAGVISLAGIVTAGLVESDGRLPPGLQLISPAG